MLAASPSSFEPAGAGGLLLAVLVLCIGVGVALGWLVGSVGIGVGVLIGAVVGILGGIFAVYRRYRGVI
jgi:Flp pilus assembly protein TadB